MLTRIAAEDVCEILDALQAAQIRAWVAGGWAIDALLDAQTRSHGDLDLVVDFADVGRTHTALETLGFQRVSFKGGEFYAGALMPRRFIFRDASGRKIDLHGVDLNVWPETWFDGLRREGRLVYAIEQGDAFAEGRIGGRPVPCLSAALQVASRQVYEPSAADKQDMARLCARFDLSLPRDLEPDLARSAITP